MKNKKAFTLIELLAVIVILAIIALIATPIVMNVIKTAQTKAAEDSAQMAIKAFEDAYAMHNLQIDGDIEVTIDIPQTKVRWPETVKFDSGLATTTIDTLEEATPRIGTDVVAEVLKNHKSFTSYAVTLKDGKVQENSTFVINGININVNANGVAKKQS